MSRISRYSESSDFREIETLPKYLRRAKQFLVKLYDDDIDVIVIIAAAAIIGAYFFSTLVILSLLVISLFYLYIRSDYDAEYLAPGLLFFILVMLVSLVYFYLTATSTTTMLSCEHIKVTERTNKYVIGSFVDGNDTNTIVIPINKIPARCYKSDDIYQYNEYIESRYSSRYTSAYECIKKDIK